MFHEFIKMDKASRKMAGEISEPGSRAIEIVDLFPNLDFNRLLIPIASTRYLENGLQMIEFLGRVVEKLLGRYNFLDELSTLDPDLMYVKLSAKCVQIIKGFEPKKRCMLLILGFSCSVTWVQILAATFYHPQGMFLIFYD
ncbi:E3 ubiquitin-protein ligase UPL7 [Glycine max]|nr:E3 ubiquitin-protein ligase UPL7 [Glycine max]